MSVDFEDAKSSNSAMYSLMHALFQTERSLRTCSANSWMMKGCLDKPISANSKVSEDPEMATKETFNSLHINIRMRYVVYEWDIMSTLSANTIKIGTILSSNAFRITFADEAQRWAAEQ